MALAVSFDWPLKQLDVHNAFFNGDISETVYMALPPGFEDLTNPTHVCCLKKALYELKQNPRAWYMKLNSCLLQCDFQNSRADASLFYRFNGGSVVILLVYVDDIIITGSDGELIQWLIHQLHQQFSLKDLGDLSYFLRIHVTRDNSCLHLCQEKYVKYLLHNVGMVEYKPRSTLMGTSPLSLYDGELLSDATTYRSLVGAL